MLLAVAINKIDVDGARIDYVKQQIANHDLMPEDWGGQTVFVEISAKEKIGNGDLIFVRSPRGPDAGCAAARFAPRAGLVTRINGFLRKYKDFLS